MYNAHRGMAPPPSLTRLNELLDGIRAEFSEQARSSTEYDHSIQTQMAEMQMVREKVFQMEQTQLAMKQKYAHFHRSASSQADR